MVQTSRSPLFPLPHCMHDTLACHHLLVIFPSSQLFLDGNFPPDLLIFDKNCFLPDGVDRVQQEEYPRKVLVHRPRAQRGTLCWVLRVSLAKPTLQCLRYGGVYGAASVPLTLLVQCPIPIAIPIPTSSSLGTTGQAGVHLKNSAERREIARRPPPPPPR